MAGTVIWRWVLQRWIQNPWFWLVWIGLLWLVPLLGRLSPESWGSAKAIGAVQDWAFPAGLLGAVSCILVLSEGEGFLCRLPGRTRWLGEFGALTAACLYLQLPIAAGALAAGARPLDLARAALAILALDLHLSSIALLLLVLPLHGALRAFLLAGVTALVPALLADANAVARALGSIADATAPLRRDPMGRGTREAAAFLGPLFALCLAGYRLRTAPVRSP